MLTIALIGNITRDAVVKDFNGNQYAAFTVAVNRRGSENADFIDVLKYGDNANLMPYLRKGTKVYVGGKLSVSAYIGKNDGQAHANTTVWCNDLELVGGSQNQQGAQQQFQAPAQPQYQQTMQQQYAPQPQFQQQAPQQFAPPTPEQRALGQQRMARAQGQAPQQPQVIGGPEFMAQVNNPGTEDLPF